MLLCQLSQPFPEFVGLTVGTGHMILKQPPRNVNTGGQRECGGPFTPVRQGWDKRSPPPTQPVLP